MVGRRPRFGHHRIGFASRGVNNWVLAGYRLEINGRPFASNNAVNARAQAALASAQTKLAEADSQMAPLQTERDELQSLVEAQLATPEDQTRLAEVRTQLDQLQRDKTWSEGQIQGRLSVVRRVRIPFAVAAGSVRQVRARDPDDLHAHRGGDRETSSISAPAARSIPSVLPSCP